MKFLTVLAFLLTSGLVQATEVAGKIFYQMPDGTTVTRQVTLDVPARGQGEVVLRGEGMEWRTTRFRSYELAGKKSFVAVFNTEHDGQAHLVTFSGTYYKASDKILYYGDMFKGTDRRNSRYIGGFFFRYNR